MGKREDFARALLVEYVAAISTVVLAIREAEGSSTSHANIGVSPFRGRTTVQHALGNVDLGWEMEAVPL